MLSAITLNNEITFVTNRANLLTGFSRRRLRKTVSLVVTLASLVGKTDNKAVSQNAIKQN